VPRREALILLAALNHPWLLHDHLEELASLEFRHADAERLKAALIIFLTPASERSSSGSGVSGAPSSFSGASSFSFACVAFALLAIPFLLDRPGRLQWPAPLGGTAKKGRAGKAPPRIRSSVSSEPA
jgi:hypothetical protein